MRSRPRRIPILAETVSSPSTATTPDDVSTRYALTNAPSCRSGNRWMLGLFIVFPPRSGSDFRSQFTLCRQDLLGRRATSTRQAAKRGTTARRVGERQSDKRRDVRTRECEGVLAEQVL